MNPTKEQVSINTVVANRRNLIVQAGAGTGKSTTLRYLAQVNPERNFLVLCFNSANAVESNEHEDKPKNIFYSTLHSIAYRDVVDAKMRKKLMPYLNFKDLPDNLFLDAGLVFGKDARDEKDIVLKLRKGVQEAVTLYCRSDSNNLLRHAKDYFAHVFNNNEVIMQDADLGAVKEKSTTLSEDQQVQLAEITRNYWLSMIDSGTPTNISHDVYLKLYQLRGHSISSYYDKLSKREVDINVLCMDEAQDTNPVASAIFDASNLKKVIVGDSMQQLYAWRGAGDMMTSYNHFEKEQLSVSFRFNDTIASMANVVLGKAGSDMQLEGNSTRTEINTRAILCRTNSTVIATIFDLIQNNPQIKIKTNIDFKDIVSKLYHINACWFNQTPKFPNKSLKAITNKAELQEALELSPEIAKLSNLQQQIASYSSLSEGIKTIQNALTDDDNIAYCTISTIHKSKGLEWDEVRINEDFLPYKEEEGYDVDGMWENHEQLCMLYVAITRAKVKCNLPSYLDCHFLIN